MKLIFQHGEIEETKQKIFGKSEGISATMKSKARNWCKGYIGNLAGQGTLTEEVIAEQQPPQGGERPNHANGESKLQTEQITIV